MSITEDRKEKDLYELGYLVLPSIAEEKLSDVVNSIKGIIKKFGGEETASEDPVAIDLAYTMSKTVGARKYVVDEAYIGWIKFNLDRSSVIELNDAVKKLDEVLRFLLIKDPKETGFTFAEAMKAKEEVVEEGAKEAQAEGEEKVVE